MSCKTTRRAVARGTLKMNNLPEKPFADLEKIEIANAETVLEWGKTLVIAPHPDDESLGCGGAIALLRGYECEVGVLTLSDGTQSHPNSVKFPQAKLRAVREAETRAALKILGVAVENARFLRLPDRRVPHESAADFAAAAELVRDFLNEFQPQTILVPWRRDPHPDHRAAWQICAAANRLSGHRRIIEYPIWLWEMAETADLPAENEVRARRLAIAEVVETKQRAIHAHLSQTTDLIDDDPHGFRLSPSVLAHFAVPFEIYLESINE